MDLWEVSAVNVSNSTFRENQSGTSAALRFNNHDSEVRVSNCTIENQVATQNAEAEIVGPAFSYGSNATSATSPLAKLYVTDCLFRNNTGEYGSASVVDVQRGWVQYTNNTFQDNVATFGSGHIHTSDEGSTGLYDNNTFIHNMGKSSAGMVINSNGPGCFELQHNRFEGNEAPEAEFGSGLAVIDRQVFTRPSTFYLANNSAPNETLFFEIQYRVPPGAQAVENGMFFVLSQSRMVLAQNAALKVAGATYLQQTVLYLEVNALTNSTDQNITVMEYYSLDSTFQSVQLVDPNGGQCEVDASRLYYAATSFSVAVGCSHIDQEVTPVTSNVPVGAIVGGVIGGVVFLVLVAVLIIFLVPSLRQKVFPHRFGGGRS